MDAQTRYDYWKNHAEDAQVCAQLEDLGLQGADAVEDAFFKELEFGTAGLRGVLGAGTNRMNIYTVGKATQGFANYLNAHANGTTPHVAIARDNRNEGEQLVARAASVLAANGIVAHLYPRIEPTPALSFAVRDLGCAGGICMTASHNPAAYNGYKVYDEHGCQIASEVAEEISNEIARVDAFDDVRCCDFDEAVANGKIQWIAEDTLERFIDRVFEAGCDDPASRETACSVVYTPLHGTGLEGMKAVFERYGIDGVLVEEQLEPDGDFPTCPYPNPETREALEMGVQVCEQRDCDLVLATDPDADRVGVAVRTPGGMELLTGNEIGILMLDYLARMKEAAGTLAENPVAVTTIVSTAMVDPIAAEHNIEMRRVLTGFKYIGEIITELERNGQSDRFLLGFEESYGYLTGDHVRDKDAINAGLVICQMARHYKRQGMNLFDAMQGLYQKYGHYANRTINVSYPGAEGAQRMESLMRGLRENPPTEFAGMPLVSTTDYQPGLGGLPKANVLEFGLGEGRKVVFRPSGTEPKVKAYLFARADSRSTAQDQLDAFEEQARKLME